MNSPEFDYLKQILYERSGLVVTPEKGYLIESRLAPLARRSGLDSVNHFIEKTRRTRDETMLNQIVDAMTTNETLFFRDAWPFERLRKSLLPEVMAMTKVSRRIRIWSAACSTGAEPYTLAMVASEFAQGIFGLHTSIIATDLCTAVLDTGLKGIYPATAVVPVPEAAKRRYIMYSRDTRQDTVRIVPELRSLVQFGRLNLMDESYAVDDDMDVIFCRNILIYFDKPTQEAVLNRLCDHLRPGGYLFLGHSESLAGFQLPLRPNGNTVFRRV